MADSNIHNTNSKSEKIEETVIIDSLSDNDTDISDAPKTDKGSSSFNDRICAVWSVIFDNIAHYGEYLFDIIVKTLVIPFQIIVIAAKFIWKHTFLMMILMK